MFDIINNYNEEVLELDILEKYVTYVVKKLKLEKAIFNFILVDEEEIHELNKTYRKVDRPTDVITFALEDGDDFQNPEFRTLGDVYICVPIAYKQAEMYGHSRIREICFLATHGILHLLGYDHMEEEEREQMEARQREIVNGFSILR